MTTAHNDNSTTGMSLTGLHDHAVTVHAPREMDSIAVPALRHQLAAAVLVARQRSTVVLDLGAVTFLSTSGLELISDLQRAIPHLVVVAATRPVLRPLHVTGLDALLRIHPDLDTALDEAARTHARRALTTVWRCRHRDVSFDRPHEVQRGGSSGTRPRTRQPGSRRPGR
jgi:anti-sigma B factor antagonist